MSAIFLALFQLSNIFFDFNIVLKVVGLLFIYSFVRSHVQHPILSLGLIIFLSAFLLFDFWTIFGSALILYLLAIFGVLHILVDLSFMHAFTKPLLNVGGMFSPKRPTPSPPQQYIGGRGGYDPEMHDHQGRQPRGREEMEGEEMGEEYGPEHQGDNRAQHRPMSRQEMEQQRRMQYERMRRGRGRGDERER